MTKQDWQRVYHMYLTVFFWCFVLKTIAGKPITWHLIFDIPITFLIIGCILLIIKRFKDWVHYLSSKNNITVICIIVAMAGILSMLLVAIYMSLR